MPEYAPTWRSLDRHRSPQWFADDKFGIYFHWGPYSVPAYDSEWYPRNMYRPGSDAYDHHAETYGDPAEFGYKEFVPEFTAEEFDAEEWAALCAEAGAEFVGITAIHHDGFAMWDSDLTEWNAGDRGPERDVVGELAAAVRDRGMKFVTAFHHAWTWWYYPREEGYDTMDPAYADLYGPPHEEGEEPPEAYFADWRDKVVEVIDGYRPDLLYFDFGWGNASFLAHDRYRREVLAHYFNRAEEWGKEVDVCHKRQLPPGVGIVDHERTREEEVKLTPWLTDTSVDRASWGYVSDPDYKSAETLVTGLVDRVSKNGCTMLNVGPRPDGTIPAEPRDLLGEIGDWLDVVGEGIYGSRPWWVFGEGPTEVTSGEFEEASSTSYTAADLRFTRRGNDAYVFLMDWPDDGEVTVETTVTARLEDFEYRDSGAPVGEFDVELVGADADPSWRLDGRTLVVSLPDEPPHEHVPALRIVPPE